MSPMRNGRTKPTWKHAMESRMHHSDDEARQKYRDAIEPGHVRNVVCRRGGRRSARAQARLHERRSASWIARWRWRGGGCSRRSADRLCHRRCGWRRSSRKAPMRPSPRTTQPRTPRSSPSAAPPRRSAIIGSSPASRSMSRSNPARCARAPSANARIERLVYGAPDAKGGGVAHGARVFDQPQCHWKPAVTGNVRTEEAARLLRDFFRARR